MRNLTRRPTEEAGTAGPNTSFSMKNLGDSPPTKCKDKYKTTTSTVHGKEEKKRPSKVASNVQTNTFDRTTTSKDEEKDSATPATLFSNVEPSLWRQPQIPKLRINMQRF
jgi:hypothetical protein